MFGFGSIGREFGPSNLRAGQLWEYRDHIGTDWSEVSGDYNECVGGVENACEVLSISIDQGLMGIPLGRRILVRFIKCDTCTFSIGDEFEFSAENFGDGYYFKLIWDSSKPERYGVYCGNCGGYFEYAKFSEGFKCWACRNGWNK